MSSKPTDPASRFADLQRQGFMKSRKTRTRKAPLPLPMVSCADCLNWHPKGKHTASVAERRTNRKTRLARESRDIGNIAIESHGSIVKLTPRTDAARQWLETNANAEIWQWQDGALVVDTRAAAELLDAIERRER